MRKFLLSLSLLLLMGMVSAQAQVLKIGVLGGISSQSIEFKSVTIGGTTLSQNGGHQYGYQFGATMRISIPDFLQIQTDLIYSEANSRINVTNSNNVSSVMSVNSIEMPIMIGFNISNVRFFAGPLFRLSSDVDFSHKYNKISATFDNSDVGFQMGAGIDMGKFFIDARYTKYPKGTDIAILVNGYSGTIKASEYESLRLNMGLFF